MITESDLQPRSAPGASETPPWRRRENKDLHLRPSRLHASRPSVKRRWCAALQPPGGSHGGGSVGSGNCGTHRLGYGWGRRAVWGPPGWSKLSFPPQKREQTKTNMAADGIMGDDWQWLEDHFITPDRRGCWGGKGGGLVATRAWCSGWQALFSNAVTAGNTQSQVGSCLTVGGNQTCREERAERAASAASAAASRVSRYRHGGTSP